MKHDEFNRRASELIEAGRFFHTRSWVPATSGNFSARLADGRIAITVSGLHKGDLSPEGIMLLSADGEVLDDKTPSAETGLHVALYQRFPDAMSVLHAHPPSAVLASRVFGDEVVLEDHELLKLIPGITTHDARVVVPIFPNDQDISRLANRVNAYLDQHESVGGYIIAGHGLYAWGASVDSAMHRFEAFEHMLDVESRFHGARS
jgi:methylthioribulose-1-phosphate dehydratase